MGYGDGRRLRGSHELKTFQSLAAMVAPFDQHAASKLMTFAIQAKIVSMGAVALEQSLENEGFAHRLIGYLGDVLGIQDAPNFVKDIITNVKNQTAELTGQQQENLENAIKQQRAVGV
jgi:hypothetical protein